MDTELTDEDVAQLTLPPGTHAAILRARDVVTGGDLAYPVVWADRTYGACPRCGEQVSRTVTTCPVHLDAGACQGGQLGDYSQQHGCGEWLTVPWEEVRGANLEVTAQDVLSCAHGLAARRTELIAERRERVRAQLRRDLIEVLRQWNEPLFECTVEELEEQIRTGDDMTPGVYRDAVNRTPPNWVAWDFDPSDYDPDEGQHVLVEVTGDQVARWLTIHATSGRVVDRKPYDGTRIDDIGDAGLAVADLGCEPGIECVVQLVDAEDDGMVLGGPLYTVAR